MPNLHAPSPSAGHRSTKGDRLAASALAVQALGIVVLLVLDLVGLVRGESDKVSQAVMLMVTLLLLGLFVAIVARALRQGRAGARIPAIVWNVMLLPVGFDMARSDRWPLGVLVLALVAVVVVGCALAFRADPRV